MSNSVEIAKDRLKTLLVSDRMSCTPDVLHTFENELYRTISKYVSIKEKNFKIVISRNAITITFTGENE